MRTFLTSLVVLSLAVLTGCKKPQPPAPAEEPTAAAAPVAPVTFGQQPIARGERFIDSLSTAMKRADPEPVDTESRLSTRVEVLDTDGAGVLSARVTYAEEADLNRLEGKGVHGPMHGKTFVVSLSNGEFEAREVGGADAGVSVVELGRLKADFWWLGKPNPWRAAAQGKTLKAQQDSVPVARALADTMTVGWAESSATASARYLGQDGGLAQFAVTVDQTMNASQPRRSQAKLSGSLYLRVRSGDFAALSLDGPLEFWEGDAPVSSTPMKVSSRRRTADDMPSQ